tara:strand:+ start:8202 stop:8567 length:366 start_codon:yes stop_codon:yes gene_type:complete
MSVLPHAFSDYNEVGDTAALFIARLRDQKDAACYHVMLAWDGEDAATINFHLTQARAIVHAIAAAAAQLGYADLGASAIRCETQILTHLEGDYTDLAICPCQIIYYLDVFVEACTELTGCC